jgi:hypothetical protein
MPTNGALLDDTQNPQSSDLVYQEQNTAGAQQLATVQVQSRYAIARKFPRDIEGVRQRMLRECQRPSFCMPDPKKNGSSVAIYRVPRGGSNIEGVSIRFAEMAARNFGNLGIDVQQVGEDQTQRIYLVTATDYETNLVSTEIVNVPKTIERKFTKDGDLVVSRRTNSKGETIATIIATDDDIAMKRNALLSKARRNLILGFIPGWLIEESIEEIRETARKKDAEDPDAAKRKIFDAFATVGVTVQHLNEYLGHSGQLQPKELEDLRGYFGAIREGHTTWAEVVAAKDDDKDGSVSKQIDELLRASGRTAAIARKLRAEYATRPQELLDFLKAEAVKKADTGAAPQAAAKEADTTTQSTQRQTSGGSAVGTTTEAPKTEPIKTNFPSPGTPVDPNMTLDLPGQAAPTGGWPKEQSKPAPPPIDEAEWSSM